MPLIVHSKLFRYYNGKPRGCWYDGLGDDTSVAIQDHCIRDMDKFGIDTITLNICNEGMSSPFTGEFMNSSWHEGKIMLLLNFIKRLKDHGKIVVIVFFDFPQMKNPKYPFWKFKDRIPTFLEIVTTALSPYVDGFIFGIETNRQPGPTIEEVEFGIAHIQKFAFRMNGETKIKLPVGTHEQNVGRDKNDKLVMFRRVPSGCDFHGYETSNHPFNGYQVPVARMVEEVSFLTQHSGAVIWVIEATEREDANARKQWNDLASIPGVVGVGGPT